MRVKLFSQGVSAPIQSLEDDINEFLESQRPHVTLCQRKLRRERALEVPGKDDETNDDHAPESAHDRIMRIIRARCGDVLTERDVASLADAQPDPDDRLPSEVADRILYVLAMFEARLIALDQGRAA